jgi:hypothetical protein
MRARAIARTLLLLGACASGDDPAIDASPLDASDAPADAAADLTPPRVVFRSPDLGESDAPREGPIRFQFSEPIAPESATPASFVVTDADGAAVPGDIVATGDSIIFTPATAFAALSRHDVLVRAGITDLAGNHLDMETSSHFTTGESRWGETIELVDALDQRAANLNVAAGGGLVLATWTMATCVGTTCSGERQLWYAVRRGGVWSAAPAPGFVAHFVASDLVIDAMGKATLVYSIGQTSPSIFAMRYDEATGWSGLGLLENESAPATSVRAAVDGRGNVYAIWRRGFATVGMNRYVAGVGWQGEEVLASADGDVDVVAGADGGAVAVWIDDEVVWASRFEAGTWRPPTAGGAGGPGPIRAVMDADGAVTAAWVRGNDLTANRFATGWGAAVMVDRQDIGVGADVGLVVTPDRAVHAAWTQDDVWWSRFATDGGWSVAAPIENGAAHAISPALVTSGDTVLATWIQESPATAWAPWASELVNGSWRAPHLLSPAAGEVSLLQPYYDAANDSYGAVWLAVDGDHPSVFTAARQRDTL